ncbi:Phosphonates import ATP-binding protein PhnC 2 [Burkholderiales bacterium 8X]|nr:Phosphonates import ATP-binding protein PhnC 2 [Burkholderiales bacterium 8X]
MKVELRGIEARHPAAPRGVAALRGLTLQVQPGEQLAVIGPSGAGKSTLLQVAAAALEPSAGALMLDGVDAWSLRPRMLQRLRGRLFLAPQTPPLPPRQRVVTAVLAGRLPAWSLATSLRSLLYPVDAPAAHQALDRFDLGDKLFARVDRLSGGERQRVALARALVSPATLWLVDEPLSALDPAHAAQALSALVELAKERGITLIATLHQVDAAMAHFPRLVGLRDGRVAFDRASADVTRDDLASLYARREGDPEDPASGSNAALPRGHADGASQAAAPESIGMICR